VSELDYWRNLRGEECRLQQEARRVSNRTYELQESWLTKFLDDFSGNRKTQFRLLDYGCGFGRIADVVCKSETVDYFGFDISHSMTAPFRANPPPRLQSNIEDRLRVADQLDAAFPVNEKFDVILSVSVLIHNRPDVTKDVLAGMLDRLTQGGVVVLIENPHTAVSALENFWHGGCWCHSFARYFDRHADVEIIDNFADRHAIYIAHAKSDSRESRFFYRSTPEAVADAMGLQAVMVKGLDRATLNSHHFVSEWSATQQDHATLVAHLHDSEERLAVETSVREELSHAQDHLTREVSKLRKELSLAQNRFAERQRTLEDLAIAVSRTAKHFDAAPAPSPQKAHAPTNTVEWNAFQDTRYSHPSPEFEKVLHVFHREWFGIRAAAGSLPGAKLAIPADVDLSSERILEIHDEMLRRRFDRIVFHGHSKNSAKLLEFLAKRGLSETLYLVKHGAPAQWTHSPERVSALHAIELLKQRKIKRLHVLKPGFRFPIEGIFEPLLFNMSPNLGPANSPQPQRGRPTSGEIVFAPGWTGWRKNLYTAVLASTMSPKVNEVWIHAADVVLPDPLSVKLKIKHFLTRETTFELMEMSSICANVSLVDCHPMVNLEAQTMGRPCLRGNLFLDALEEHPYVRLTNIADVSSVDEIVDAIETVASVPQSELRDIVADYQAKSDDVSRSRYLEFLEL
jgi:SAM-dependent methyltransferase